MKAALFALRFNELLGFVRALLHKYILFGLSPKFRAKIRLLEAELRSVKSLNSEHYQFMQQRLLDLKSQILFPIFCLYPR